jgi:hypothetical protein
MAGKAPAAPVQDDAESSNSTDDDEESSDSDIDLCSSSDDDDDDAVQMHLYDTEEKRRNVNPADPKSSQHLQWQRCIAAIFAKWIDDTKPMKKQKSAFGL